MKKKELESSQKYPETLEEQRDYYLKLYEKWANWQTKSPEKLPESCRYIDFVKTGKEIRKNNDFFSKYEWENFSKLVEKDNEVLSNYLFLSLVYKNQDIEITQLRIYKPIVIFKDQTHNFKKIICFYECYGENFYLINQDGYLGNIEFTNCNFSHITLENFDRGYFSPQANEYLNEIEKEGKLTLINCTWSGLPVISQNIQNTSLSISNFQTTWSQEINFVNGTYRYKVEFNQYLAFFEHFLTNIIPNNENKKVDFSILSKDKGVKILIQTNDFDSTQLDNFYQEYIKFFFEPHILEECAFQFNQSPETMRLGLVQSNYSRILDLKKEVNRLKFDIDEQKNIFQRTLSEMEKEKAELKIALGYKDGKIIKLEKQNSNYHQIQKLQAKTPTNIYSQNSMPINFTQNNNIQTLNGNIENKITEINNKSNDLELKEVLGQINDLKNQILTNLQINIEEKEDNLLAIKILTENIEQKDNSQNKISIRNAIRSIGENISLNLAASALFEIIKKYFGM